MPQFPQYQSQKRMTTAGGPQRMGDIGGSGLESVGGVIGQAGQALQGINREIVKAERTANVNKAEAQLTEAMANARARLQTMNEATLANFTEDGEVMLGEEGESLIESLDELKVDGIGGDRVEEVIERSKSQLRGMAKGQFLKMRASRMNSEALANYSTAIDNGNPAKAKQFLENSHEAGILSTETYNEKMAELPARAQFNFVRDAIANGHIEDVESVRKNPGEAVQELGGGEDWQMGVGYQDVMAGGWQMNDEQWADLERHQKQVDRQNKVQQAKAWEEGENDLLTDLFKERLTVGKIEQYLDQGRIAPKVALRLKARLAETDGGEEAGMSDVEMLDAWSSLKMDAQEIDRGDSDEDDVALFKQKVREFVSDKGVPWSYGQNLLNSAGITAERSGVVGGFDSDQKLAFRRAVDRIDSYESNDAEVLSFVDRTFRKDVFKTQERGLTFSERNYLVSATVKYLQKNPDALPTDVDGFINELLLPQDARLQKAKLMERAGLMLGTAVNPRRRAEMRFQEESFERAEQYESLMEKLNREVED